MTYENIHLLSELQIFEVISVDSVESFKNRLDKFWSNQLESRYVV